MGACCTPGTRPCVLPHLPAKIPGSAKLLPSAPCKSSPACTTLTLAGSSLISTLRCLRTRSGRCLRACTPSLPLGRYRLNAEARGRHGAEAFAGPRNSEAAEKVHSPAGGWRLRGGPKVVDARPRRRLDAAGGFRVGVGGRRSGTALEGRRARWHGRQWCWRTEDAKAADTHTTQRAHRRFTADPPLYDFPYRRCQRSNVWSSANLKRKCFIFSRLYIHTIINLKNDDSIWNTLNWILNKFIVRSNTGKRLTCYIGNGGIIKLSIWQLSFSGWKCYRAWNMWFWCYRVKEVLGNLQLVRNWLSR